MKQNSSFISQEEDCYNEINTIIDNIKNQVYFQNEEIENDLKQHLSKLDQQQRLEMIQHLHQQFPDEEFIKRPYFQYVLDNDIKQSTSTPDAINSNYIENFKKKEFDQILQDVKNKEYCDANQIPIEIKDYLTPLSQIRKDLHLIFELIELMKDRAQFQYLSILKVLINLFFIEYHNDIKRLIHQLVGFLLENQIYKFEYYIEQVINQNKQEEQYFKQCIEKVQFLEISVQQGQDELLKYCKNKSILFLFELLNTKLEFHAQNLLNFIRNLIYKNDKVVNKDDLIQYISLTENFDQNIDYLYFKLVFYFWIQYILKFNINESIGEIEKRLSKSQKKQTVLVNGIVKFRSECNDRIYRYMINKIIYYKNIEGDEFFQAYKQQEKQEQEFINIFETLGQQNIEILIEKQLNESKSISNKLMFYQFQRQNQNKSIHFFKFLAINDTFDKFEVIRQWIKDSFKCFEQKQFASLSYQHQINLLQLQQALKNNTQLKMSRVVKQKEIFNKYPKQLMIQMEEFNISLTSQMDIELTVQEWLKNRGDKTNFKKLLPYYFNIIKRGESPEDFLALINKNIIQRNQNNNNETFNLKSLFQLLYNNSDKELQVMLLKIHSKNYPVPLLYQNPQLENNINSILDYYAFNSNIYYLLSNDFTIINFCLSKKANQFGKSELMNILFYDDYKDLKFEVSDSSSMNQNSIDCQFDFSFNGSRNYLVADVHGQLEDEIYVKLLPFFKLWIIQIQSENQFEENLDKLIDLLKKTSLKPKIILIIRDSEIKQFNKDKLSILQQQSLNIKIHQIPNLSKLENKAIIIDERQKIKEFIVQMIDNQNKEVNEKELQKQFLEICKSFKKLQDKNDNSEMIINNLSEELEKMIKEHDGFYSIKAFPLRHLQWRMQCCKKQKQELNYKKMQYEQELEKKQNAINDLKKENIDFEQINQKENEKEQININIKQAQLKLQQIILEISQIEQQNKSQNYQESNLIIQFNNIFNYDNFYIIYLRFVELIAKFNKRNFQQLNKNIQEIKLKLASLKEEQQKERSKLLIDLKQQENQIIMQTITIELFWREVIQGNSSFKNNPVTTVCNLIKKGEPFEFLNGDNLSIDFNFFHLLRESLLNGQNNKILFLSILGPQSSGKSTLLNRIFGCHFLTSMGRCTKGLYLQMLKIQNKEQFGGLFDYIVLLDSEGLQNPNQKDPEFDKKISLLIISISDVLIFNVKGEIHSAFHNLIESSFYTLAKFSEQIFLKQFAWCFNQNSQINDDEKYKLLKQIESIGTKLNFEKIMVNEEGKQMDYTKYLDITIDNVYILGMATNSQEWQPYNSSQQNKTQKSEIKQEINQQEYSKNALSFGVQIIRKYIDKYKQSKQYHHEMLTWNSFITNVEQYWDIVSKLPDLVEFSDLKEQKDYEQINKIAINKMTQANGNFNDFEKIILEIIEKSKTCYSLQDFDFLQKDFLQNFQSKCLNQKQEMLKIYKIISEAIRKKVIGNIEEVYSAISLEVSLIILQTIHQQRRQFQYNHIPAKIQQKILEVLNDSKKLQIIQKNEDQLNSEFEQLCNQLIQSSNDEIEKKHTEFQIKLFDCFSRYQKIYSLEDDLIESINYFVSCVNRQDPNTNKQNEIQKICEIFNQDIRQNYFYNLNKQSRQELKNIFDEDIQKRIKNMPKFPTINPLNYLEVMTTYYVLEKTEIVNEIKQNLKQQLINITNENKGQIQKKQNVHQLFATLKQLPIEFDERTLKEVLCQVDSDFQQFQDNLKPTSSSKNNQIKYSNSQINYTQFKLIQMSSSTKFITQSTQSEQNSNDEHQKPISLSTFNNRSQSYYESSLNIVDNLINSIKISQLQPIPMIKFSKNYILQYFPKLKNFKVLYDINIQEQNNIFVFNKETNINCKQSQKSKYENFFNYIINQKTDQTDQQDFYQKFSSLFLEIMNENQGWNKLFSEIYDIIYKQFNESIQSRGNQQQDYSNVFQLISMNEDLTQISIQLIYAIKKEVQNKIEAISQELAFYGIEFNPVVVRKLNLFSFLIIWRFICYDKLKMYQQEQDKFMLKKAEMKSKFQNSLMKKELEEINQLAKEYPKQIYNQCIIQFYKDNKNKVRDIINSKQKTSSQIIKQLDQQLLIEKIDNIISGQLIETSITEYLIDQRGFIKKYVEQFIQNLQKNLENQFLVQFYVENCLNLIKNNASILLDKVLQLSKNKDIEIQECFDKYMNQTLPLDSIFSFIRGKDVEKLPNFQYQQIFFFDTNIKQVNISIEQTSNYDISLFLMQPFLIEFISQISILSIESKKLKTSIDEFQLKWLFKELYNNLNGCEHTCPMCNRKCDYLYYQEKDHKHKCNNGHQLRGMNRILIRSSPSLFTCEEINDEAEIQIKENRKFKTWREIKQIYNSWSFKDILSIQQVQENKQKMIDIWNGGVGQYICQQLSKELQQEIIYLKKHDLPMHLQHSSTHYIFILDDSGSMYHHWTSVIKCVKSQLEQINKKENVKVSVVIFNKDARIVVNCQTVKFEEQLKLLVFQNGPDTKFGPAFKLTLDLIKQNSEFNQSVILFYTDGQAEYPKQEIESFAKLSKSIKDKIYFLACSQPEKSLSLEMILNFCQNEFTYAEWRDKIQPSNIDINWTEMISNTHLEKYKA
ncbi:unnamed protein product [Paramecium primaurelia]|uniref:VLIG-type G domain-containing protein n=1 Tax=Paramecium primaurelia TaxID=5886 RepID=A0A8S1NYS8_PARPR|nr:unnamed protein product [Paramecium primaurelia]